MSAAARGPIGVHLLRPDSRVIERPGWYQILTPSCRHSFLNEVIFSELEAEDTERVIGEVIAQYRSLGLPFKWCVGPWTRPHDLGARLERLGFEYWDVRGMVCDPARLTLDAPREVAIEPVGAGNADEFVAAYLTGWEFSDSERDATRRSLLSRALDPESKLRFFLARYRGEAAGTASVFFKGDGSAYLTGGNVLPGFRGNGIYRALIARRLELLRERGIRLATTQARAKTSAPILARLGFETVFESRVYQAARFD